MERVFPADAVMCSGFDPTVLKNRCVVVLRMCRNAMVQAGWHGNDWDLLLPLYAQKCMPSRYVHLRKLI